MIWLISVSIVLAGVCVWLFSELQRAKQHSDQRAEELRSSAKALAADAAIYKQKLNALSQSSGAGILMLDKSGTVVHANVTAERMLNAEPDGLLKRSLIQATFSAELQQFVLNMGPGPDSYDFQIGGAQGPILRASKYRFPMGVSGEPETMLVLVDVTELRRLETVRRDFVGNVSHELRTPLASIRAIAETLQDGAIADEDVAQGFLSTIVQETDRLARIAADLLILSDAESKEPEKSYFDLTELLKEVVERFKPHAAESGLSLALEAEKPLQLLASRDQVEQVVVNLVSNATKYTPSGGKVLVRAHKQDENVVLDVIDNGIGIMHEHLPRLFERFYRVDKARSRASGGTGLGLSIVKHIVESHEGEIRVASEYNRGSTFTVMLPAGTQTAQ
ncbi:MAG: two-component system, OmpR family, phosphate regulon sensor histidine kinase PhoR [Fimbriimonadaceae bacterium]|jgi:two-component system phosphate regulon sensor histidine kinase PhoR|nr:two-component system, OmpR family, phosphate regulon sensor histidine kinase PhoR [Fimbriimonadaceae bacterium]